MSGDFPRRKRGKHELGFRADNGADTVKVDGKAVILPKIGRVAMVGQLRFQDSIREMTVDRTAGRWFACLRIEGGQAPPPVKEGLTIGVDLGVGTLATCSYERTIENPEAPSSGLKQLRRLDQAFGQTPHPD